MQAVYGPASAIESRLASDLQVALAAGIGLVRTLVMQVNAEIVRALKSPEMAERFAREGADLYGNSPEEFAVFVKIETAKWAKAVKLSGARPD